MDTSQPFAIVPKDKEASVSLKRQRRSIAEKWRIFEETGVLGESWHGGLSEFPHACLDLAGNGPLEQ
jgi:hypothetical protein